MSLKLPVVINPEEFGALLKRTHKQKHKVAFLLGFGSGLRISEICNLEQRDFDFQRGTILVRQGKGKKDRIVPIPKIFKERNLKEIPIGLTPRSLQRAFHGACKRAGLLDRKPELHFHSLRHGFATECLNRGMTLQDVKFLLGHSNISTTNVYLHSNPTDVLKKYQENF